MDKNSIREMALGFQKSRIFLTAFELGVFTAVAGGNKSSSQVASALKTNPRATDRLMNTLCAIGFLKKKGDKFSNRAASLRFLVKASADYMAGLMHTVHLWDNWNCLTPAVKQGKPVMPVQINEHSKDWLNAFIAAMHERAQGHGKILAKMLDLKGVKRVLDVGGGSGVYSMAIVRAKKGIKAVVFDLPEVTNLTKKYIEQDGLGKRMETEAGDYTSDNFKTGFDLVFLSSVIHSNPPKENAKLIRKCVAALRPGGQLVIQDFIMDESRTTPVFGATFALNMLVATQAGDTYTEGETRLWMKEAGLTQISRKDTAYGTTLITGRK